MQLDTSKKQPPTLFLYDVTSSYLEGENNALADWGYNRDGKKGKKQVVIGLLCEEDGTPISTEVFKGNTQDTTTFAAQLNKIQERYHCKNIVFVGDRGMIKSGQIEQLTEQGHHYITAITKKQIETLIDQNILDYTLFDDPVAEIVHQNIRYLFRRNPIRAEEIASHRMSKKESVSILVEDQNRYLQNHPKAQEKTARKKVNEKIKKIGLEKLISVYVEHRTLYLLIHEEEWKEESRLDGCYVIKTDLLSKEVSATTIHERYKDLAWVESAFRTMKSDLDIRPIYVRTEASTRGHVLVVMLAYLIVKELDRLWSRLYLTVSEGLQSLSTLCLHEIGIGEEMSFQQVPEPREQNKKLLQAAGVELPKIIPKNEVRVVTRVSRRKSALNAQNQ